MSEQVPLGIVDAAVPRGSHVCTFFSGPAQPDDVVAPFLAEGIRSGNKCVAVLEAPGAARFSFIRATGEMPSVLDHPDGRAEFFRYESVLTAAISALPEAVVCLYDLERFGAEVLMDTLRTHPGVIVDGMMYDNPYYIEPGKFLATRG